MTNLNGNNNRTKILGISGSLRSGSFNTALLRTAQEIAPDNVEVTIFDLISIPFYNGDVEAQGDPESVVALKNAIHEADGVLFATPEYNHSTSGVLKNALDWASRDRGESSLTGKPVTLIGAGGMSGTARAQLHLQNVLSETGSLVMVKPGVFVAGPWEKFDSDGHLTDEGTGTILRKHLEKFFEWIKRVQLPLETLAA